MLWNREKVTAIYYSLQIPVSSFVDHRRHWVFHTISHQNNVLFQPIIHLFKVFKGSNLSVFQFITNFVNLCECSVSMKKEKDILSLLLSRKRITFSLSRPGNFSIFNVRFQFFQQVFNTC